MTYENMRSRIQVVTLDNFYHSLYEPNACQVFIDMVKLRAAGFGPEYPKSFLPLERGDFFARHHVIYLVTDGQREPVACYKQIPLSLCDFYKNDFPLSVMMKMIGAVSHLQEVERLINQAKQTTREVIYGGSLTLSKNFRLNHPSEKELFFDLMAALFCLDYAEFGKPSCIIGAATRFKIDRFFEKVGYERMKSFGHLLDPVPVISAANEPVVLMSTDCVSEYAKSCLVDNQDILASREWIRNRDEELMAA
ncbi:hypothetical protein WDW37_07885 [Bdellovibrionota bacterium FG-1]